MLKEYKNPIQDRLISICLNKKEATALSLSLIKQGRLFNRQQSTLGRSKCGEKYTEEQINTCKPIVADIVEIMQDSGIRFEPPRFTEKELGSLGQINYDALASKLDNNKIVARKIGNIIESINSLIVKPFIIDNFKDHSTERWPFERGVMDKMEEKHGKTGKTIAIDFLTANKLGAKHIAGISTQLGQLSDLFAEVSEFEELSKVISDQQEKLNEQAGKMWEYVKNNKLDERIKVLKEMENV